MSNKTNKMNVNGAAVQQLAGGNKLLTTKEVAKQLCCSGKTVRENAKICLPNKVFENGKQTFWTESEVTVLIEHMKGNNNRNDLTCSQVVQVTETSLTPLFKAKKIVDDFENIADTEVQIKAMFEMQARILKRLEGKNRELEIQLDENKEWYSIKRMEKLNPDRKFDWRLLKATSDKMGLRVQKCFDANYGEVNAYHVSAWEAIYYDGINY